MDNVFNEYNMAFEKKAILKLIELLEHSTIQINTITITQDGYGRSISVWSLANIAKTIINNEEVPKHLFDEFNFVNEKGNLLFAINEIYCPILEQSQDRTINRDLFSWTISVL